MSRSTDSLITELSSEREATRESAIARLTVVGARAVDRLILAASSRTASSIARAAALTALERIGDRRALQPALALTSDPDADVAIAAVAIARVFLRDPHGVEAVDRLTAIAVDPKRAAGVRAAALEALKDLGPATVAPLLKQLAEDPIVKYAEPAAMRVRVEASAKAPLSEMAKLIDEIRERERTASRDERAQWLEIRGAAHALLARRGSTVALYDLRETIERATVPLPPDFAAAAALVGDASCLEPIAAGYYRASDVYWKKALADAFRAITKRTRTTRRSAVIRKIEKRWPGAARGLGIRE